MAAVAVWLVERQAATSDWNFTVAKSAALASWLIALAAALRILPIRTPRAGVVPFALCFVVLGLNAAVSRVGRRLRRRRQRSGMGTTRRSG